MAAWDAFLQAVLHSQGRAGELLPLERLTIACAAPALSRRPYCVNAVRLRRYLSLQTEMWRQTAELHDLQPVPPRRAGHRAGRGYAGTALAPLGGAASAAPTAQPDHVEVCAALGLRCEQSEAFELALQASAQGRGIDTRCRFQPRQRRQSRSWVRLRRITTQRPLLKASDATMRRAMRSFPFGARWAKSM